VRRGEVQPSNAAAMAVGTSRGSVEEAVSSGDGGGFGAGADA
jgi:hypothetical protein